MIAPQLRPRPLDQGDREITIHHELDGPLQRFGKRFWALAGARHPATQAILSDGRAEVVSVRYRDRYLFTPLSVALLINLIEGLRETVGRGRWADPEIAVITTCEPARGEHKLARHVWSDWSDRAQRDAAIVDGFDYLGMLAGVTPLAKRETQHGRVLEVGFSTRATMQVRFDQGVSYWWAGRSVQPRQAMAAFPFGASLPQQAQQLAEMDLMVEGTVQPTHVFLKVAGP